MKNNKAQNARVALEMATAVAVSKMKTGIEVSIDEVLLMTKDNFEILQDIQSGKMVDS